MQLHFALLPQGGKTVSANATRCRRILSFPCHSHVFHFPRCPPPPTWQTTVTISNMLTLHCYCSLMVRLSVEQDRERAARQKHICTCWAVIWRQVQCIGQSCATGLGMNGSSWQTVGEGKGEGWADAGIKVRWMSSSSAGCGTTMTKQPVTGMAGDPGYGTNKRG